jgi:outer membrane receptor protein involved in Fe transport
VLNLDSELLFVGDAGATEPSARSRRRGVTIANFYRPIPALSLDADVSFARARLGGAADAERHIPGAIERVVAAGVTWGLAGHGVFGALRARHFGSYPLTEEGGVRARAATLLNADVGYEFAAGPRLQATVLNLANASRLRGEPAGGVDDVHSHPVEPRQVRASLGWRF